MTLNDQHKQVLLSYARSVVAAVLAVAATGNYNADDLVKAALAAAIPPLLRWSNPNDAAFGRGYKKKRTRRS
jgi:hypothetical protein